MNSLSKRKDRLLRKLRSEKVSSEFLTMVPESYDSKEFQVAYSKIMPLVVGVRSEARETMTEITANIVQGYRYCIEILEILDDTKLTQRQKSLMEQLLYMMTSEGLFSQAIQLISYLLVENHHDLYDPGRMKSVKSYGELIKLSLFVKMQFVEKHGFKFLTDVYDRNLRNCIAHNKYSVREDETIFNNETNAKIEDLQSKGRKLVEMVNTLGDVFNVILVELRVHLKESARMLFLQIGITPPNLWNPKATTPSPTAYQNCHRLCSCNPTIRNPHSSL